ncbi:unnamed protein product [Hymenolepis diminuta]|uniref:Uncharacterized protein n=1 Tax=Hymenolepis diminuta TaxID=6216 RepID=A0A564YX79_HYMDI|nr:unnamed protein product [Hymenolepis diminuta]
MLKLKDILEDLKEEVNDGNKEEEENADNGIKQKVVKQEEEEAKQEKEEVGVEEVAETIPVKENFFIVVPRYLLNAWEYLSEFLFHYRRKTLMQLATGLFTNKELQTAPSTHRK